MDEIQKTNILHNTYRATNKMMMRTVPMLEEMRAMLFEMGQETLVERPELEVDCLNDQTLQRHWEEYLDVAV